MEVTRHFTATTFIVYQNKTLLHLHKKLNMWLPPGGHIDRDELPEEAAIREVKEETGLDVVLYKSDKDIGIKDSKQLHRSMHVLLENINEFHQHIDYIYYAAADTFEFKSDDGETNNIKWLTKDEIINDLEIQDDVRVLAIEAMDLLAK